MSLDYVSEKFEHEAIRTLATGSGTIQDRLANAHGAFHSVRVEDFPGDLGERFRAIIDRFAPAAALKLSDEDAREVADELYSISIGVNRVCHERELA